jgi:excisionase family DNA binding protein
MRHITTKSDGLFDQGTMSIGEAAKFMGTSTDTVYRLLRNGKLPYTRVGTDRKIPRAALVYYLEQGHVPARA